MPCDFREIGGKLPVREKFTGSRISRDEQPLHLGLRSTLLHARAPSPKDGKVAVNASFCMYICARGYVVIVIS